MSLTDTAIYSIACSVHMLAKTVPHVDADRAAQLVRHADAMLARLDNANRLPCDEVWVADCISDIPEYVRYLLDAVDNAMSELPATFAHPAGA